MTDPHPKPTRANSLRRLVAIAALALAAPFPAAAVIEPDFERGTGPAFTTWYGPANPAACRRTRAISAACGRTTPARSR